MSTLLWTIDDYLERTRHPNPRVRAWAMKRLLEQHPLQALDQAVESLADQDHGTRYHAFHLLDSWGGPAQAPRLLEGLERARGDKLEKRARLLANWGCQEAAEPLLANLESRRKIDEVELSGFCHALGLLAPQHLGPWVRGQLDRTEPNHIPTETLIGGLALCHHQPDIAWLIDRWPGASSSSKSAWPIEQALKQAVGPHWLADVLPDTFGTGVDAVLASIEEQEGASLPLSGSALAEIIQQADAGMHGWPSALLAVTRAVLDERAIPFEAWRAAAGRPEGYRWQVLATLGLLEHLASWGPTRPAPDARQRRSLLAIALAGLAGVLADQDDLTWLA